jgi:hypothetical protein
MRSAFRSTLLALAASTFAALALASPAKMQGGVPPTPRPRATGRS